MTRRVPKASRDRSTPKNPTAPRSSVQPDAADRQRIDIFLEQGDLILWTTDENLVVTSSLGRGLERLGLRQDEVTGRSLREGVRSPSEVETVVTAHKDALRGVSRSYTHRVGDRRLECVVKPLTDQTGRVRGCLGLALDVTELQNSRRDRQAVTEQLRALIEGVEEYAIVMLGPEGGVLTWNQVARRMFGYKAEAIIGRGYDEFFTSADRSAGKSDAALALARRHGSHEVECWLVRRDGSHFWGLMSLAVLHDEDGAVTGFASITRDYTHRRKRERDMLRLVAAVDQVNESVLVLDVDGVIQMANRAFEQSTGWTSDEVVGKSLAVLEIEQDNREAYREIVDAFARRESWRGHLIRRRRDATPYEVDASLSPVRDRSGAVISFVMVKHDVTEQRRLERRLQEMKKAEALATLAGGIAHDFNNILQPIILTLELMLSGESLGDEDRRHARRVLESAERARELVGQITTYSRPAQARRGPVAIAPVLEDVLATTPRPPTISTRAVIEDRRTAIRADPSQLRQIFANLCTNAVHAMHDHGGVLEVIQSTVQGAALDGRLELRPGRYCRVRVSDSGPGMPEEVVDRIFDPFFTTKTPGEGTGLGLGIVRGLVQSHGGAVTVWSKPGSGSVFTVYLPVTDEQRPDRLIVPAGVPAGSETILLVDDDREILSTMGRLLRKLGYAVVALEDPLQALDAVRSRPEEFDLVVTDARMGTMSGADLAAAIHNLRPAISIMIITGFAASLDHDLLRAAGVAEVLQKPLNSREFAAAVRRVLDAPEESGGVDGTHPDR